MYQEFIVHGTWPLIYIILQHLLKYWGDQVPKISLLLLLRKKTRMLSTQQHTTKILYLSGGSASLLCWHCECVKLASELRNWFVDYKNDESKIPNIRLWRHIRYDVCNQSLNQTPLVRPVVKWRSMRYLDQAAIGYLS